MNDGQKSSKEHIFHLNDRPYVLEDVVRMARNLETVSLPSDNIRISNNNFLASTPEDDAPIAIQIDKDKYWIAHAADKLKYTDDGNEYQCKLVPLSMLDACEKLRF